MEFAACLHGNTELQKLEAIIDYNLTLEGASALAAAMCNSQLTKLRLTSQEQSMKGDLLQISCQDGIQASGRVWDCLEIYGSGGCVIYMRPVAEVIPFLKALLISQVGEKQQTNDKMYCLVEGLERSCNLSRLALNHCRLDADNMRMLSRALRHHRSLKELNLASNSIKDAGVAALVKHLDEHPLLKSLVLNNNHIGSTGVKELLNAVGNRPSMKVLEMRYNSFGYSTLQMIGEHLLHLKLQVLGLGVCTNNLVSKQSAYQYLLRGLKNNHYLRELDLSYRFGNEFGNELAFYVALSNHGRYLIADANAVLPSVWCIILAKCGSHVEFTVTAQHDVLLSAGAASSVES